MLILQCTAAANGTLTRAKAREGFFVRRIERQLLPISQIQLLYGRREAARVGERILDGDAHIRHAELRDDGVVLILNERVHDAFAVHNDVDVVRLHIEKPLGFDEFESLIHERGAVYGDLRAHVPVRVL